MKTMSHRFKNSITVTPEYSDASDGTTVASADYATPPAGGLKKENFSDRGYKNRIYCRRPSSQSAAVSTKCGLLI